MDHGADSFRNRRRGKLRSFAPGGLARGPTGDSEAGAGVPELYHIGDGLPSLGSRQPL